MSGSRVRYSINLDEDFELYGIDPNENLDDWSFLDEKPEPIPEKSEEEKMLFEQLLQPTINEEAVSRDIHARLKNLISETDKIIQNNENDPLIREKKEELKKAGERASLNTQEIQSQRAGTPEMQQANRVKSILQSILKSTEKAEDISDFIEEVTKSDKVDPDTIEVPDSELSKPVSRLLPEIKKHDDEIKKQETITVKASERPQENENKNKKETEQKEKEKKEEIPQKSVSFASQIEKKSAETNNFLKSLDETERLSQKFAEERKKREEEAKKEAERKQKEIEEKSRKFLEALQKEQERREKMPAQIAEFAKQLNDKMNEINPAQKPAFVLELLSEKQKPVKTKIHESKTFISNINAALAKKLKSTFEEKRRKRIGKAAIKVALFLKFALEKSLVNKRRAFILRNGIETWVEKLKAKKAAKKQEEKNKEIIQRAKRTFAAIRLQQQIRVFLVKKAEEEEKERKRQENERKNREALEAQKRKFEEMERKKKERMQSLSIQLPENDDSWINSFKKEDSDSDLEQFLDSLETKPVPKVEPQPSSKFELQSGTTPFDDGPDSFISSGKQKKPSQDPDDDEIARVRAEIEARVRKARLNSGKNKDDTTTSVASAAASVSTNRSSISSNRTSISSNSTQQTQQSGQPRRQQNEEGEEYQFSAQTQALMRMAQNRHKKGPNYKNEAPLERYNRIYGGVSREPPKEGQRIPKRPSPAPAIMRQNNTRARRLQKLQKAWFDGNREENQEHE